LIAHRSPAAAVRARSADLRTELEHARVALQSAQSSTAAVLNSTIVVFREGLEAALILAALAASFTTGGARWRRPLIGGMLAALPATLLTWVITDALLDSFSSYGLQLEAGLDAAALVVLAIIMAWFFQRFCWTRFVARTHARRNRFTARAFGGNGASVALAVFGFTVLYREGFETVLYLAALKLRSGGASVLEGVVIGILATVGLAFLMLRLRRRLPYRAIVVVTAVAIGALLVVMAGQAARAFEAVGWLSIHPVQASIPVWAGQWLGIYPAVEPLVAQLVALAAIPAASEAIRRGRNRRQARRVAEMQARKAERAAARRPAARREGEAHERPRTPTRAPL
jgi:high-affinity iron transporter